MYENDIFLIYQLKEKSEMRDFRFEPLARIKEAGLSVERGRYNHMYTGALLYGDFSIMEELEAIFNRFNVKRPEDFSGHSLSMSDVVVLRRDGSATANYVDRLGFAEVPEFIQGPYRYYSTQRPIDIGTFPKTIGGPVQIVNYDKRAWVENATFRAWGYLTYDAPLTDKCIGDYELRAAPDSLERVTVSPYQLQAQLQVIGKWEQSKRIGDLNRITWWVPDFGVFAKKEGVTHEQVADRFDHVIEAKARAVEKRLAAKKPIAEQLAEAEKQVRRDAETPAPGKTHISNEDR